MKKILFILHYPPPVHGASMVGEYIKNSKSVNSNFSCRYINLGTSLSIDEIGSKGFLKFVRYFKIVWATLFNLTKNRPDLVYITLTTTRSGLYKDSVIAFICKMFGVKVVYHLHNKGVSKYQDRWLDNLIYKLVFKKSQVILLSEYLYPDIKKYVSIDQVHYCANGIPKRIEKIIQNKEDDKNKKTQLLFLSNLISSKGVFILLKACKILQRKSISFSCNYVGGEGDINKEDFKDKIISFGLTGSVHYLGKKYGIDKELVYNESDIFILPTFYHNECFPLVLLEAMQYSLPIISTHEGAIQEIVQDEKTGYLVEQQNAESLASKIEMLIHDRNLRMEMGENGKKLFDKKYTLSVFEKNLTKILKNVS